MPLSMSRLTLSARLRGRLRVLMKHGDAVRLADWSQKRPGGAKILQQEISYFLNPKPPGTKGQRKGLTIDDLDDVASYFRLSVGQLLDEHYSPDMGADEQRMLLAFRALPDAVREHFLAIIETASVAPRHRANLQSRGLTISTGRFITPADDETAHGDPVPSSRPVDAAALIRVRDRITDVTLELSNLTQDPLFESAIPNPGRKTSPGGGVAP